MIRKFAQLLGISKEPKKEVETQTTLLQKKQTLLMLSVLLMKRL